MHEHKQTKKVASKPVLVIHGGAGVIPRDTPGDMVEKYEQGMKIALKKGYALLKKGGTALDATMASVIEFEKNPLFNAGRGAVYTADETHEMDAAIMDGKNLNSGAACTVRHIRHPIKLARKIMEQSPHRLLSGDGAEAFARQHDMDFVENSFFDDEIRFQQLLKARQMGSIVRDHDLDMAAKPMGTFGAVALDVHGNLAAATSTGGTTNKFCGRVGDTPVPGAGNYADNRTCAVSCTGFGEEFMKKLAAYDLHSRMIYSGLSLDAAAQKVVFEHLDPGTGGLIAVDARGNFSLLYNTPGMFRGYQTAPGDAIVKIWE